MLNQMESIDYISENHLQREANLLANKIGGNVYLSSIIIANNYPQTDEYLQFYRKCVEEYKRKEKEQFEWFINEGWKYEKEDH